HTIANLKITGNNDYVGLFGYTSNANILNIHIISGSVSGKDYVGSVCGSSSITHCSNASSVSGENYVGGICGSGSATACYNTGSVSGSDNYVGGICGTGSVTACYNTGSVSGKDYVGGVCGSGSYIGASITACYNTGSVSGSYCVGGVCGFPYSYSNPYVSYYISITACYNTGSVSGGGSYNSSASGVIYAYSSSTTTIITACYWKDVADDNADYGVGSSSNTGTSIFSITAWPTIATHTQWGTGDGSGDGKYWKSLGGWNGGNPVYPKLFFED
ncbi:MAG: hypothetical protein LBF59_01850, partial [Prevotellaceae bacterium]|nr:hypothetical protein [Prevotellaceae bacterium]